jgi:hypothetical protein
MSVNAVGPEPVLQGVGLLLGESPYGRGAADGRIVMQYFLGSRARNQLGQGLAADAGEREVNDIGVAKKIKKEGLDSLRRVRAAELKENYS